MSDFSGFWEDNESRAMLLRSNEVVSGTIYYGLCTSNLSDPYPKLGGLLDEIATQLSDDEWWEFDSFKKVADGVLEQHADDLASSSVVVLYGALEVADEGIVGVYWKHSEGDQSGDFAFLPQDENRFVAALTTEPTLSEDGWWLRQGMHPAALPDDDD